MDQLRDLNKKKDSNLKKFEVAVKANLKKYEVETDRHMDRLRELNKEKDADIENLRAIIKEMRESHSWKLVKKFGFLKKDDE
jgi:hypothetical protein